MVCGASPPRPFRDDTKDQKNWLDHFSGKEMRKNFATKNDEVAYQSYVYVCVGEIEQGWDGIVFLVTKRKALNVVAVLDTFPIMLSSLVHG